MIRYPIVRQLFSLTLLLIAVRLFRLGGETSDFWFFVAAGAFALGSMGLSAQILLTYRGDKRQ
jgi:hypothetical protein